MNPLFARTMLVGILLPVIAAIAAAAEDANQEAIKKDRQQIEGTWRVVSLVVNGNTANDADAQKIKVVNGSDGTWAVIMDGKEISQGTSTFDPAMNPKAIDFTPAAGADKDKVLHGIYEIGEKTRKLCFAPVGKDRPTDFSSTLGSEYVFVTFERVSPE